ncbi:uncharacterized protein LOC103707060 isoform X2 [Phoenix dactylifera]|uniref:Uncharacterized protein LOC103707060 isoform X2 n=1 Tax=Phoenix dactylifera TaxID=42345 RepID=A0A8B8J4E3_PHODC|nr:uncharacterized protein LOC103707060 isoform X2 [Phoenix dactylifera]
MSPNYDEFPWDSCRKSISSEEEECKSSNTDVVDLSRSCSDLSTVHNMCLSSTSKRDGYVYKRRKLHRNSIAILTEENRTTKTKENVSNHSCMSSEDFQLTLHKDDLGCTPIISFCGCSRDVSLNGDLLICEQHHVQKSINVLSSQIESVPNSGTHDICSIRESEMPAKASIGNLCKPVLGHYYSINDRSSSSKSNTELCSAFMKTEVEDPDAGECSSSDIALVEPWGEFTSARDLCISLLKSHGLLGSAWAASGSASLEVPYDNDDKFSQTCKICGLLENPKKMLICDLCEQAYHLSCCNTRVKKLPVDEWYCQPCFRKKPKPLTGKPFNAEGKISGYRKRMSYGDLGSISFMLTDTKPYTSGVRIGKDFQAEVPDWCGPVANDHDYFDAPSEIDPGEFSNPNEWNGNKTYKRSSIGNWIQCRGVVDTGGTKEEIICGKWRRAPLYVVQTDDWDCSCSVLWDPVHADCAVPQLRPCPAEKNGNHVKPK